MSEKLLNVATGGAVGMGLGFAARKIFDNNDSELTESEKNNKHLKYLLAGGLGGTLSAAAAHHYLSKPKKNTPKKEKKEAPPPKDNQPSPIANFRAFGDDLRKNIRDPNHDHEL